MIYNKDMKHRLLIIMAFVFVWNTVAVSAWSAPCAMNDRQAIVKMTQKTGGSVIANDVAQDMPCHEVQSLKHNTASDSDPGSLDTGGLKHCEGICLCFESAMSHTVIVQDIILVQDMSVISSDWDQITDNLVSTPVRSLYRPPKYFS